MCFTSFNLLLEIPVLEHLSDSCFRHCEITTKNVEALFESEQDTCHHDAQNMAKCHSDGFIDSPRAGYLLFIREQNETDQLF